jgi:hypothetical protein
VALRDAGVCSLLALPLIVGETTNGVPALIWRTPSAHVDMTLADLVAAHAATTIAYARLRAQLRHELRQVDLLRQVTEAISSELTSLHLLPRSLPARCPCCRPAPASSRCCRMAVPPCASKPSEDDAAVA